MAIRTPKAPPVDCDVCGAEITATLGGPFLDCEVVDLHDGTPVKDVCRSCSSKPLSVIFEHITERTMGHPMRPGVEPPKPEPEPAELEPAAPEQPAA